MASIRVLTLSWDEDLGEAKTNFAGLDKLYGIERADFLDDAIAMLIEQREQLGNTWANDYA